VQRGAHVRRREVDDADVVRELVHHPRFAIVSHRDRDRLEPHRDLGDEHRRAAGDVEHRELVVRRVDGEQSRAVGRHRQRVHLSALEMDEVVRGLRAGDASAGGERRDQGCAGERDDEEREGAPHRGSPVGARGRAGGWLRLLLDRECRPRDKAEDSGAHPASILTLSRVAPYTFRRFSFGAG
jgi:hypothetical protein